MFPSIRIRQSGLPKVTVRGRYKPKEEFGLSEILRAHREMIAPTTPYTQRESEQASREIGKRLEWLSEYLLRGGGIFQPKFRERMAKEAKEFAGFGGAYIPLAGRAAMAAIGTKAAKAAGKAIANKAKMASFERGIRAATERTPANLSRHATNRLLMKIMIQNGTDEANPVTIRSYADLLGKEVPKTMAGKEALLRIVQERVAQAVKETPRFLEK